MQSIVGWKRSAVHAENDRQIVEPDLHARSEKFGPGRRGGAESAVNDPTFLRSQGPAETLTLSFMQCRIFTPGLMVLRISGESEGFPDGFVFFHSCRRQFVPFQVW